MRPQNLLETSPFPRIVIENIGGDFTLTGWERTEFRVTHGEDVEMRVDGDTIFLQCDDDCRAHAPRGATIELFSVGGDAIIHAIDGGGQIHTIGGDLRLHDTGALIVDQVGGDCTAQQVAGDLRLQTVGGDAKVSNVQGNCHVTAGGDIQAAQIGGQLVTEAGGDANLRLSLKAQQNCQVEAGGDILCRLPDSANATIQATTGGAITVKRLPAPVRRVEHELVFSMGSGETLLTLNAGGDITLLGQGAEGENGWGNDFGATMGADFGVDFAERAAQIAQQVVGQVERQMEHLSRHLDEKLARVGNSDEIAVRVQERVQGALRKAEEKIAETMRHTEQRMRDAESRMNAQPGPHGSPWRGVQPPPPPRPPQPPRPTKAPAPVNDEERRMILRMVSEGKVSVEQADQLLAALGNPK
jgi:ElaB/YqjD/DUF883 family membrane-anchored ribosome-binding protein